MLAAGPAFTFVDLFAGIGGFHAALSGMGGECVYAVEIDKKAAGVYERNWGLNPFGDVTADANDLVMKVPAHDVLVAGFPCQPFSKSGYQRGMDETRGTLYWNILKIIEARRPAVVLLENVRNLAGPRHRHEWAVIVQTLRDEGYRVADEPAIFSPHLLPPALGGRPQVRERVFITATRADPVGAELEAEPVAHRLAPVAGWHPTEWNLEQDLPLQLDEHVSGTDLTTQEVLWIDAWDDFVQRMYEEREGRPLPGFPLWADHWVHEDDLVIPIDTPAWKADFLRKNSAFFTAHESVCSEWLQKWGVLTDDFPPSRRKFEWQAQDTPRLWDCVMHFRPSGVRAKRPTYLPALVAITQTSIVGPRRRRLSTREAARLQGLPDWFDFGGQSDADTYRQLGNGVSIGAVWHVLKAHVKRDSDLLAESAPRLLRAVAEAPNNPDAVLKRMRPAWLDTRARQPLPSKTVNGVESSGSQQFDQLRDALTTDQELRREVEWLLGLTLDRFNPSARGNRWVAGGVAEWALTLAAFNAGLVTLPAGHDSDGHDLVDLRDQARALWSVKSSFQGRKSAFIITNGLGGAGQGLTDPTVFLHPLLPGVVYIDPSRHEARTDAKGGETRLAFEVVARHAAAHPECVAPLAVPENKGEGGSGDAALDAVRTLTESGVFSRLNRPFRIVESRHGDVVTRLRDIRELVNKGEITEEQGQQAITKILA